MPRSVSLPVAAVLFAALLMPAGACAARKKPGSSAVPFSDEAVEAAIDKGVEFILSQQKPDGSWPTVDAARDEEYTVAPTAICVYALLESGLKPTDKRMAKALEFLGKTRSEMTYCHAFRALAYAAALKYDPRYHEPLRKDVRTLILSIYKDGGYTYYARGRMPTKKDFSGFTGGCDQSNAQYGLLGVWAGARHNEEIPRKYWELSLRYWMKTQFPDGGWAYSVKGRPKPYLAMTLAGLASVYVCTDNLFAARHISCRGNPGFPAAERAMDWVTKHYASVFKQDSWFYYTMYGVERVGLATGYKYFGKHDWYKQGAVELLRRQDADGSWTKGGGKNSGGKQSRTCYAILFLLRGRQPVLFNRLEYDGDWNNRPRALANLTRWFTRTFERDVHWQIINLDTPVEQWHDAPILVISGAKAPTFTDTDLAKLRTFVHQGGSLLSITECRGGAFDEGMREVYKKLFPDYPLADAPRDHPMYTAYERLGGQPAMSIVSNGARPLAVHTTDDLTRPWQAQRHRSEKRLFDAAANIVAYTNDKLALAGGLRFRGTTLWPAEPKVEPERTATVARIRHAANCDPEPLAHERFARLMLQRTRTKVDVLDPVPPSELDGTKAKLALLTGTGRLAMDDTERAALKAWVEAGGTLLIDAAGGDEAFAESAEAMVADLFGRTRTLTSAAPFYKLDGYEIDEAHYRRITRTKLGNTTVPRLRGSLLQGRPAVLLSREDITCGLLGNPSYTVDGYTPETAYELLRNVVLWMTETRPAKADAG